MKPFVAGAFAEKYQYLQGATAKAQELIKDYGPVDVTDAGGRIVMTWEDGKLFEERVNAAVAVAKAKAEMREENDRLRAKEAAERRKTTWVGGTCPEYYQIPVPVLGVTVMPFDIIDALKMNFNMGCVVKYVLRAGRKGPALQDLEKARNCIDREIANLKEAESKVFPAGLGSGTTASLVLGDGRVRTSVDLREDYDKDRPKSPFGISGR